MKKTGKKGAKSKLATESDGAAPVPTTLASDTAVGPSSPGDGDMPASMKTAPEGDGPCFNTRSRTKEILKNANDEKKDKVGKKEEGENKKENEAPAQEGKAGRRAVKWKLQEGTATPPKKRGTAKKRADTPHPCPRRFALLPDKSGAGELGGK